MRRVTFYTEKNNIFYLELAIDRTEFIKLHDFDSRESDPDALMATEHANRESAAAAAPIAAAPDEDDNSDLLKSLGM